MSFVRIDPDSKIEQRAPLLSHRASDNSTNSSPSAWWSRQTEETGDPQPRGVGQSEDTYGVLGT